MGRNAIPRKVLNGHELDRNVDQAGLDEHRDRHLLRVGKTWHFRKHNRHVIDGAIIVGEQMRNQTTIARSRTCADAGFAVDGEILVRGHVDIFYEHCHRDARLMGRRCETNERHDHGSL